MARKKIAQKNSHKKIHPKKFARKKFTQKKIRTKKNSEKNVPEKSQKHLGKSGPVGPYCQLAEPKSMWRLQYLCTTS